jgi:hypothetical protein
MPSATHTPEYWLARAEEARSHARQMTTDEARRQLLIIAVAYQRLAEHAEHTGGRKLDG